MMGFSLYTCIINPVSRIWESIFMKTVKPF
nr:MAG TPA: hypothetical protein [Caudoviricetes sp.]